MSKTNTILLSIASSGLSFLGRKAAQGVGATGELALEHLWHRRSLKGKFISSVCSGLVAASPYVYFTYPYSDGFREGQVAKFSHKGVLCKTWEGELAMRNFSAGGSLTQAKPSVDNSFAFSVTDPEIATEIREARGPVRLTYRQYLSPLSMVGLCYRRTEYEVTGVEKMGMPGTPEQQLQIPEARY